MKNHQEKRRVRSAAAAREFFVIKDAKQLTAVIVSLFVCAFAADSRFTDYPGENTGYPAAPEPLILAEADIRPCTSVIPLEDLPFAAPKRKPKKVNLTESPAITESANRAQSTPAPVPAKILTSVSQQQIPAAEIVTEPAATAALTAELTQRRVSEQVSFLPVKAAVLTAQPIKVTFRKSEPIKAQAAITATIPDTKNTSVFRSEDFRWEARNGHYGVHTSPQLKIGRDGKSAFQLNQAGVLLQVKSAAGLNPHFGIFVEKSDNGIDFHTIGILNAQKPAEMYYFDTEISESAAKHYRFRSEDTAGQPVFFGELSVIREHSFKVQSVDLQGDSFSAEIISAYAQPVRWALDNAENSNIAVNGKQQLNYGENTLNIPLPSEAGFYNLTLRSAGQTVRLLTRKTESGDFLTLQNQSGKQNLSAVIPPVVSATGEHTAPEFDFYLKSGNALIFSEVFYKNEPLVLTTANLSGLPRGWDGRVNEYDFWIKAGNTEGLRHAEIPVVLAKDNMTVQAQVNVYATQHGLLPLCHRSHGKWIIPGMENAPRTELKIFNDWGNLVYQTAAVTEKSLSAIQKLPAGNYTYLLGDTAGTLSF